MLICAVVIIASVQFSGCWMCTEICSGCTDAKCHKKRAGNALWA